MVFQTGDSQILRIYIYVDKVLNLPSPEAIEIFSLRLPNSVSPTVSKYFNFLAEIGSIVLIAITKMLQENCID